MDSVTKARRSEIMARVRAKDTKPEMRVRKLIHGLGFRYRLHAKELPGHPDIVLRPLSKVVFVHGCFWHRHSGCALARLPKSRTDFWIPKLEGNRIRDRRSASALRRAGWKVLTVWECQTEKVEKLEQRLEGFLNA